MWSWTLILANPLVSRPAGEKSAASMWSARRYLASTQVTPPLAAVTYAYTDERASKAKGPTLKTKVQQRGPQETK
eukprot:1142857-Rhodomonas_salina.2